MKKFIKTICLTLVFALTFSFAGCGQGEDAPEQSGNSDTPDESVTESEKTVPQNEEIYHENKIIDTDGYVVKDGYTDYKIVIPSNPLPYEGYAANELQELFNESTGIKLSIVSDDNVSGDKIFSLGRTRQFSTTGVTVDKYQLREDGFKMFTRGNAIYICGGGDTGTLYGVYEYLNKALNFEQFYEDCYTLDKNVRQLKLYNYDITERPDVGYRSASYGYMLSDSKIAKRMRISGGYFGLFTAVKGQACHNSFEWLPLETYYDEHPKWYSNDKTQVCYTAHGDAAELELMLNAALKTFKGIYAANPNMKAISFTINDYRTFCSCPTCSAANKKYGTDAAVCVWFCNKLSKKMEAYVKSLHSGEADFVYDIDLLFFAYNSTTSAPAKYDAATNTYSPIDNSVVCDKHVAPWYAPIDIDYTKSIYDKANLTYLRSFYGWDVLSEKMYLWTYDTNFKAFLAPYDTFGAMKDLFGIIAGVNSSYIFHQSQYSQATGSGAWHNLKSYLTAKLMWNAQTDIREETEKFFAAMYGPAADAMKQWFWSCRSYVAELMSQGKYQGSFSVDISAYTTDFWSYSILNTWGKYAEEALGAIEKYKDTDPDLYNSYYKHIACERVSVDYIMLELYESRLEVAEARNLFDRIVSDSKLCGITRYREGGTITNWANTKVLAE